MKLSNSGLYDPPASRPAIGAGGRRVEAELGFTPWAFPFTSPSRSVPTSSSSTWWATSVTRWS
ncbi:Protein of unknown function [Magnetospirillum sp. XM-1]|nr:Protein of unknown function [Magnetospirillum sp. XM-1]